MNAPRSPLILFGAQSGHPSEADAARTLETARAAGYSDFMVYARSGLAIEYMGEEWLALVGHYLRHAERLGMGIWLYDEFNWPSGSCHGRVPAANPAFANATCALYPRPDGGFDWRLFRAPDTSANVFDADAMARFRALVHEVYERRFRRFFGSVIRGVFTDEPGSGFWRRIPEGAAVSFRWYRGLEADYRAGTGRDFRADVEDWCREALTPGADGRGRVWEDYTAVLGHAFRRAFVDPATAWAERLGIVSTGHLMDEWSPYAAALSNGLTLHVLKGFSKPGVDDIYTRTDAAGAEWLTLATARHAASRTGRGAMAELFALGPADLPFDKMRQQLWLFALHGVDAFLLALHFQSPHGFVDKPHYAMFFSPLQPWFGSEAAFHDAAREAAAFARKPLRRDVGVRYRQRAAGRVAIGGGERRPDLVELLRALGSHQFCADLLDEDEPCPGIPVFDFDGSGIVEERTGTRFASAGEALAFVEECLPDRWRAEEDGRAAADLAMRRCDDGTAALVNLRERGRALEFVADGARIPIALPARGVWTYRPVAAGWTLRLDRPNRRRIRFLADGAARLVATAPVSVRFALCAVPGAEASVSLDGAPLVAARPCSFLGFGYDPFYRETEPVALAPGEHVLAAPGSEDRGLFLPVAWMEGAFAVDDGAAATAAPPRLLPVPDRVSCAPLAALGLADFAGRAVWRAEVDVPSDATGIDIGTGHAAASVRLGGRALGTRLFAPWSYGIPPASRGTRATLEIDVATSARPLFGAESDHVPGALPSGKPAWVRPIPAEASPGLLWARWTGPCDP